MEIEANPLKTKQKITKEERAKRRRNDHIAREKNRERKRAQRLNPAYRMMEQERDRERKKILRSNETFRSLEKIQDRMRKERKRHCTSELSNTSNDEEVITIGEPLIEPEVILSTFEYPEQYLQHPCIHRELPQQYNSNLLSEHPTQKQF